MNKKKNKLKIVVLVISVLLFLVFTVPLYSRPKVEISLSHISPDFPKWYKRYDLDIILNPSARFGFRVNFGRLDFAYEEFSINNLPFWYNDISGLLYFPNKNVSPYISLKISISFEGVSEYWGASYSLYTSAGLGVDWYFLKRIGCFAELNDFLRFYLSKYYGETDFNMDIHPRITVGLKFNIY